ncbi:MAG: malto-oligosyltrehalose trehalohydrolase [Chthoniobacterales bacterium]
MQNRVFSQGAEITGSGVSYRTWAPQKNSVSVVVFDAEGRELRELALKREPDGYSSVLDPESVPGTLYKYRLDGHAFPDPASRFQPYGVHGPSLVVDASAFIWTDQNWRRPVLHDLVIYELHVGTFTPEGTFRAIIEKFDHLHDLGVNTIELMPIADFPGRWNWGYDGVCAYAPSRAYGQPDDLRFLVDAAHRAGFALILDVVYNHFGPDGNYFGAYSERYFNKNHHTPWGAAFNVDSEDSLPVRRNFVENAIYWITDFHVDGFRLDATHAILDDSPKHLVQEIAEQVQERGGLVICEDPRNERKIVLPRDQDGYGCDAVWADDFHHVVRVQMTKENEGYLGYFHGTIEELLQTLREGWLFTGQLQKDGIPRGTLGADLAPEHFVHCISNHDQVGNRAFGDRLNQMVSPASYRAASGLLLVSPYTPMLFMGQEWAASSPFCYFTDHEPQLGRNITKGRRKEFAQFSEFRDPNQRRRIPDPQAESTFRKSKLHWRELKNAASSSILRLYRDFLRFRFQRLQVRRRGTWVVDQVADSTIAIRYSPPEAPGLLILAQLVPAQTVLSLDRDILRLGGDLTWALALSSNAPDYGGERQANFDPEKKQFLLTEPEVAAFVEHPRTPD